MLKFFTEALGYFLEDRLSVLPEKPVVSFALPGQVPGRNAVNLFFSALAEDGELRSNEMQYERAAHGWIAHKPPLSLKCTYIVSIWPALDDPQEAALTQIKLLGEAYSLFALNQTLPDVYLPAPMKTSGLPKPVIALQKDDLWTRPEFWTSAGCLFRTAFSFCATIHLPVVEEHYEHIVEGVRLDYHGSR